MSANRRPREGRPAIFVTGAASGIGRACAELFARRGWFVGVYDVDTDGAQAIAATLGKDNAVAGALDVSDADAWQRALAEFWVHSGERLDVLFNNAGILAPGSFEAVPLARHEAMLAVNVKGIINGCHCAFHYLQRSQGSRVINMASATAIYGQPELVTYSATKFAVRGFTEGLDLEWSKFGIRVSDIWPFSSRPEWQRALPRSSVPGRWAYVLTPRMSRQPCGPARWPSHDFTRHIGRSACRPLFWPSPRVSRRLHSVGKLCGISPDDH